MNVGTKHTRETIEIIRQAAIKQMREGRCKLPKYPKGHKPWNKGKHVSLSPGSQFKKGINVMDKHPSWKGGIQHITNDCAYVMIASNVRKRRPVLVYEEAYGPVPPGYVIYHLDGNKDNDDIENLEAISRAILVKRNRNKNI